MRVGSHETDETEIRNLLAAREFHTAFERIVAQFENRIYRLALSMTCNHSVAEDLAQDAFLRVWKALPNYDGRASVYTWIYAITRNVCFTELRRRAARPFTSLDAMEISEGGPGAPLADDRERCAATGMDAQAFLVRLPERYRQVLVLFYLDQKSYRETAAALGIPLGTVKTMLHRAKLKLADLRKQDERRPLPPVKSL